MDEFTKASKIVELKRELADINEMVLEVVGALNTGQVMTYQANVLPVIKRLMRFTLQIAELV